MISPDKIETYGKGLRVKLERLRETVGYGSYKPLQDVFAIADDLCELVIALAQNQQQWVMDQQANRPDGEPK